MLDAGNQEVPPLTRPAFKAAVNDRLRESTDEQAPIVFEVIGHLLPWAEDSDRQTARQVRFDKDLYRTEGCWTFSTGGRLGGAEIRIRRHRPFGFPVAEISFDQPGKLD